MRWFTIGLLTAAALSAPGIALAQPAGPGMGGPGMGGPGMGGPGMMRPGMMRHLGQGPGMRFDSPETYLAGLKTELGITAEQTAAWDEYAQAVTASAAGMRAQHETMYGAMDTATWQERRDMMNAMFQTRMQAFDLVHGAAEKLLPVLTPAQRAKAEQRLPGLAAPRMGLGRHGPPPR